MLNYYLFWVLLLMLLIIALKLDKFGFEVFAEVDVL